MEKPVPGRKAQTSSSSFPAALLQRKCACGGTAASAEGECEQCRRKKLQRHAADFREMAGVPPIVEEVLESSGQPLDSATRAFMEPRFGHDFSHVRIHTDHKAAESAKAVNALAYTVGHKVVFAGGQFAPGKKSGQKLLAHELTHVVQQRRMASAAPQSKLEIGPVNDALEHEADHFAEKVAGVSATATAPPPNPSGMQAPRLQRVVDDKAAGSTATAPPSAGPIVGDEAQQLGPGQMRKTEFLDKLREHVCSVADSVLATVGRTAQGCPMIERWIAHLRDKNIQHIERSLRKYASPGPQAAAQDYIRAVGERVREGVGRWAATGDVSAVPPELVSEMMGGGILGALGSALSGIGGAILGIGKLFAKGKEGGARNGNPAALQARLQAGTTSRPLESGVQSRMESVFGHSFSSVRVHADTQAAQISSSLNARAFTVGNDVAFAAGEYNPGTLIGDALIAHELAHVMQQRGSVSDIQPAANSGSDYDHLEEDADLSAIGAVVSLWSGARASLQDIGRNAMPQLRSGLRLQRCSGCSYKERNDLTDVQNCCEKYMIKELKVVRDSALPKVQSAHNQLVKSPQSVSQQLQSHFLVQANDAASVKAITNQLQLMANAMRSGDESAQFFCRDANDKQMCGATGNVGIIGKAENCSSNPVKKVFFCGDYDNKPFLKGRDWQQTMIHEYAHVGCPSVGTILPAGSEFYKELPGSGYPGPDPATAIKNADSYANFVLEVAAGIAPGGAIQQGPIDSMTAWELSQLPATAFAQSPDAAASGGAGKPTLKDYKRASAFIKALFSKYKITFDPDLDHRVLGRAPNPQELAIMNRLMEQVLKVPGVDQAVTSPGARGIPADSTGPTLQGKARVLTQEAEFLIKRYQLQWLVAGTAQRPLSDLQRFVKNTWTEMGIQNADDAVITDQELRAISLALLRDELPYTPGFYSPIDDVFYLSPGSNLSNPEVQSTAKHESTHLLAGRERTRQAFAQKYGTPRYIRFWEPFEEGMAELITMESSRPKTAPVCSPGLPQTKSSYGSKVDLMCQLIGTAGMGRDFVFEAYFTGNIPDAIFKFLEQRVP